MDLFGITAPALDLIRKRLRQIPVPDPVVYLIEISEPTETPPELRQAIVDGQDEAIIRDLASKLYGSELGKGRKRLVPGIYPRNQFPKRFIVDVSGVPFVVPPDLSRKLKGCTLDMGTESLVLTDANGNIVMPRQ